MLFKFSSLQLSLIKETNLKKGKEHGKIVVCSLWSWHWIKALPSLLAKYLQVKATAKDCCNAKLIMWLWEPEGLTKVSLISIWTPVAQRKRKSQGKRKHWRNKNILFSLNIHCIEFDPSSWKKKTLIIILWKERKSIHWIQYFLGHGIIVPAHLSSILTSLWGKT